MGLLDDAIREHLELKRRHGAPDAEVDRLTDEVFGSNAPAPAEPAPAPSAPAPAPDDEPVPEELPEPIADIEVPEAPLPAEPEAPAAAARSFTDAEPWLDDPDEVPVEESLERPATEEYVQPDEGPEGEDVLEETPEFLQETPEHDRLWFEQKPPRDFDLGN
jgi:hypothetical protein